MLNRIGLCVLAVMSLVGLAHAHGDPIVGTVTAVTSDTVTVMGTDNTSVIIMLERTTKYLKNDKPAKKADLEVGARVVIDAEMDKRMNMYSAEEVKIGTAATKGPRGTDPTPPTEDPRKRH